MPAEDHAIQLPRQPRSAGTADARRAQAQALGRERLDARRARIHRIRVRAVGIGVALFVALWGLIFVQLVSGHDPVLAANAKASGSSSSSGSAATTTGSSGSSGSSASNLGSASSSSGSSTSSGLSSLTTQQS
jgi:hypothetical protein